MATILERPRFSGQFHETPRYTIKSGVPLPPSRRGYSVRGELKYPFAQMEIGDCFDVPLASVKRRGRQATPAYAQSQLGVSARYYAKRYDPFAKFTTRVVENGTTIRVWRTA